MPEFALNPVVNSGFLPRMDRLLLMAKNSNDVMLRLIKTSKGRLWAESCDMDKIASFDGQKWNPEFDTDDSLLDSATTNTVLATSNGMILLGTNKHQNSDVSV